MIRTLLTPEERTVFSSGQSPVIYEQIHTYSQEFLKRNRIYMYVYMHTYAGCMNNYAYVIQKYAYCCMHNSQVFFPQPPFQTFHQLSAPRCDSTRVRRWFANWKISTSFRETRRFRKIYANERDLMVNPVGDRCHLSRKVLKIIGIANSAASFLIRDQVVAVVGSRIR